MTPPARRAVLFDLDDTLVDHARATRAALATIQAAEPALGQWALDELVHRHGLILEAWHLRVLAGEVAPEDARAGRFAELLGQAGSSPEAPAVAAIAARYRRTYIDNWHAIDGAVALVERLAAHGWRIGVVTNNVPREPEDKLARCGLAAVIDTLVVSAAVGAHKPDPKIFAIALGRLGVPATHAVMVGDGWQTDVAGARAAGIRAIWFNRFGRPTQDTSVGELRAYTPIDQAVARITGHSE